MSRSFDVAAFRTGLVLISAWYLYSCFIAQTCMRIYYVMHFEAYNVELTRDSCSARRQLRDPLREEVLQEVGRHSDDNLFRDAVVSVCEGDQGSGRCNDYVIVPRYLMGAPLRLLRRARLIHSTVHTSMSRHGLVKLYMSWYIAPPTARDIKNSRIHTLQLWVSQKKKKKKLASRGVLLLPNSLLSPRRRVRERVPRGARVLRTAVAGG
jgi:hypothetical protein